MPELRTPDGVVAVDLDERDRPTIRASTVAESAFGLGWACARHRRAQLDLLRRRGQGRLAELLGPEAVPLDRAQRTLGLAEVAERCLAGLPEDQRHLVELHAAGVNAWPAEGVERWRPVDTIAVAQVLFQSLVPDGADNRMVEVLRRTLPAEVVDFLLDPADEFDTQLDGSVSHPRPVPMPLAELCRLVAEPPGTPPGTARRVVTDGPARGSNAWVIARNGSVVLANDMHLELTGPSLLYAARIELPHSVVDGVTVPGLPALVAGTNGTVAWGFTRLHGDVCEPREVRPHETITPRRERVRVRGGDDVVLEVRDTRWGPVTGELRGTPVALASPLTDPAALDFGFAGLYRARDVHEAADVVVRCGLPPLNALLADATGALLWTVAGRYPDRSGHGPRGFGTGPPARRRAAESLPRVAAGPDGFLVNCNNDNRELRAAGLAWNLFSGCRARRAAERLSTSGTPDTESSAELQLDLDAGYFRFYRDLALRHLDTVRSTETTASLRAEVEAWRGTAHRDEVGLALLVVFRDLLREELFAAVTRPCQRYDEQFTYCYHGHEKPLRRLLGALDDGLVPAPWRTPARFVVGQLVIARGVLTRRTGTAGPVRWGTVNRLAATGAAGLELSGCPEALRVTQPDFGAAMRMVVELGGRATGVLTIPGGQDAAAPDERDRVADWADGLATPLSVQDRQSVGLRSARRFP